MDNFRLLNEDEAHKALSEVRYPITQNLARFAMAFVTSSRIPGLRIELTLHHQ